MKVVFLDIDGVLNHMGMAHELDEQHSSRGCLRRFFARADGGSCDCYSLAKQFDRACVAKLNALLERTGAVVVLSTSWRKILAPGEIQHLLKEHGFVGKIVGATPDLPNDEAWKASTRGTKWTDYIERGHEIEEWILRNDGKMILFDDDDEGICNVCNCSGERMFGCPGHHVDEFVILDDCCDMARVRSALVQTDDNHGLDDQDVEVAIARMLNTSPRVLAEIREEAA